MGKFGGKGKGGFKDNPKMVLLKSVITKDTDEGSLCRFYASPQECQKFAKLLNAVEVNSARIDVHIRERDGRDGKFTSGFIFMDETDGPSQGGSGGKKGYKGFKPKGDKGNKKNKFTKAPKKDKSKGKKKKPERDEGEEE